MGAAEGSAFPWVPVAEIAERTTRLLCLLRWGRLKPGTAHVMPRILKEEGNAHFSRGQLALALRCYRSGLALCRPLPVGHPDAPVSVATRIALHANVAAVLLRLDDADATVAEGVTENPRGCASHASWKTLPPAHATLARGSASRRKLTSVGVPSGTF